MILRCTCERNEREARCAVCRAVRSIPKKTQGEGDAIRGR